MKKSDCTTEEWAAYKAKQKAWREANIEKERARQRASYQKRKDKHKAYRDQPEVKERKNALSRQKYAEKRAATGKMYSEEEQKARAERQRKHRTGFDDADRLAMLEVQGGRCAVCNRPFDGRQVRADHCHDSGMPRGLLCHHCNIIEGMIRSMAISPVEFGDRLAHYLQSPPFSRYKSTA